MEGLHCPSALGSAIESPRRSLRISEFSFRPLTLLADVDAV